MVLFLVAALLIPDERGLQLALAEKKPPASKAAPKPKPPPSDDFDLLPREATPDPAAQEKLVKEADKQWHRTWQIFPSTEAAISMRSHSSERAKQNSLLPSP